MQVVEGDVGGLVRVLALELRQQPDARMRREHADVDDWGVADHVEHGWQQHVAEHLGSRS